MKWSRENSVNYKYEIDYSFLWLNFNRIFFEELNLK